MKTLLATPVIPRTHTHKHFMILYYKRRIFCKFAGTIELCRVPSDFKHDSIYYLHDIISTLRAWADRDQVCQGEAEN